MNTHPTYILLKHNNGSLKLLLLEWVDMGDKIKKGYSEVCRGSWVECRKAFDDLKN